MRTLIVLLTALLLTGITLRAQEHTLYDLNYYLQLNEAEQRLTAYKDNEQQLRLKIEQLKKINAYRSQYKVPPVALDILASRVANQMAKETAENKYISHWNLAGEKPYHRYAFAGGHDHVSENAYIRSSSGQINPDRATTAGLMAHGLNSFMAEKAPYDGHKQNIIEPNHNFVGLGYYTSGNQFSYYEEFLDRYLSFNNVPASVKRNELIRFEVSTPPGQYLHFISVYREDFPKPMTVRQLNATNSYADFTDERVENIPPWVLAESKSGQTYSLELRYGKPGLYYIKIYLSDKEISAPQNVSTQGYAQASGVVVKVIR